MISSIFGKTKPINYIIVLAFLFVLYWFVLFFVFDKAYAATEIPFQTLIIVVLLFSVFIVDFIIKRNKITEPNSFAMLFYALLAMLFPETLTDTNAVFCSLFILLATRRLISIRSLKDIKLKIFDATLWVMVASLFYEWAILYLILIVAAIYTYEPKNIRNWMVPLAGIFTVFMITYCGLMLANNTDFLDNHYQFNVSFDKAYFMNWGNSTRGIVYVVLMFLLGVFAFLKLGKAGLGKIVSMRLIALSFVIGLVLQLLMFSTDVYPIMVTFFPAVVFITNYVEAIKKPKIREVVLIIFIFIPFVVLLSSIGIK